MRHRIPVILLLLLPTLLVAQNPRSNDLSEYRPFAHIDAGITLGTTGIGFDIQAPMTPWLDLRLGFTFVPPVGFKHGYDMLWGEREDVPSEAEVKEMEKMCNMLQDLTHTRVDRFVDVQHRVYMYNAKVLLDLYPFRDRNFHFTAGFFVGSNNIGYATTMPNEGATMVGINMYNALYDQCLKLDEYEYPTITIGGYSIELPPDIGDEVKSRLLKTGPMQMSLGRYNRDITDADGTILHREGEVHYVRPNEEGVVTMKVRTHVFKPYFGVGYNAYLGPDKRWNIGCDLGAMFWGGTPHVYGEDGICLTHDVRDVGGNPGRYVRILNSFPVYPVLEFKTSYRLK